MTNARRDGKTQDAISGGNLYSPAIRVDFLSQRHSALREHAPVTQIFAMTSSNTNHYVGHEVQQTKPTRYPVH